MEPSVLSEALAALGTIENFFRPLTAVRPVLDAALAAEQEAGALEARIEARRAELAGLETDLETGRERGQAALAADQAKADQVRRKVEQEISALQARRAELEKELAHRAEERARQDRDRQERLKQDGLARRERLEATEREYATKVGESAERLRTLTAEADAVARRIEGLRHEETEIRERAAKLLGR